MNAKRFLSLSIVVAALAASASGAAAAGEGEAMTRADMRALVLQARANGELQRAGEAAQPFIAPAGVFTVSRRQVRDDVLVARALGQLTPAGQGRAQVVPAGFELARADVRADVRQANLNGELARAGEAMGVPGYQRAHFSRAEILAMRSKR
jgi:hypothetical protein